MPNSSKEPRLQNNGHSIRQYHRVSEIAQASCVQQGRYYPTICTWLSSLVSCDRTGQRADLWERQTQGHDSTPAIFHQSWVSSNSIRSALERQGTNKQSVTTVETYQEKQESHHGPGCTVSEVKLWPYKQQKLARKRGQRTYLLINYVVGCLAVFCFCFSLFLFLRQIWFLINRIVNYHNKDTQQNSQCIKITVSPLFSWFRWAVIANRYFVWLFRLEFSFSMIFFLLSFPCLQHTPKYNN